MNKLIEKVDVTFLPKFTPDTILDDISLEDLNLAYKFADDHNARAFCTYSWLIPFIEARNYTTPLASVIDFPDGNLTPEEKVFEAGRICEVGKKASKCEVDVVLSLHSYEAALEDIITLELASVYKHMNIKLIIELGVRPDEDVKNLMDYIKIEDKQRFFNIHYVKTNTGRRENLTFDEKLLKVKWLRGLTDLPLKISGGITSWKMVEEYEKQVHGNNIYGISFDKLKTWRD